MNPLDRAQALLDRLGQPAEEKPPIIPAPWRMPFFGGLAIVSFLVLAAFIWFVVMPSVGGGAPVASPAPVTSPR